MAGKHHCREVLGDPGGHQDDLKPLVYIMASKIKSFLGCFRRNGDSRLREMILLLCSALVRCTRVVSSAGLYCKRAMDIVERIQQGDSKMIMGLEPLK